MGLGFEWDTVTGKWRIASPSRGYAGNPLIGRRLSREGVAVRLIRLLADSVRRKGDRKSRRRMSKNSAAEANEIGLNARSHGPH